MKIELVTDDNGSVHSILSASHQLAIWHIAKKERLQAIIARLQQLSGLDVSNSFTGHILYAYFDSEQTAKNAAMDIQVLSDCNVEISSGDFNVNNLFIK